MMMFQTLSRVMQGSADTLKIECEACRHRAEWGRVEAFARCGSDAAPSEIRSRVRCTVCGSVRRARVWI
jgi:DNA-directed RNA polymerase subunit RPC12/RpoP